MEKLGRREVIIHQSDEGEEDEEYIESLKTYTITCYMLLGSIANMHLG